MNRYLSIQQVEKFAKIALKDLNLDYETKIDIEDEVNVLHIGVNREGYGFDPTISIYESEGVSPSITGEIKVPSWQVIGYAHYAGSRWEPPSTESVEYENFTSMFDAVKRAVFLLAEDRFNNSSENFAYAEFPQYEEVS